MIRGRYARVGNTRYLILRKFKEEGSDREMKNCIFSIYFLNQDIFHKNAPRHLKFGMLKNKGYICNLEKYIAKIYKKFPFFDIKQKLRPK